MFGVMIQTQSIFTDRMIGTPRFKMMALVERLVHPYELQETESYRF